MPTSQNGWTAGQEFTKVYRIPGTVRDIRLRTGDAGLVLVAFLAEFDKLVESVDGGVLDDWGYAWRPIRGQVNGLSNHASGTAVDVNAPRHWLGEVNTFKPEQVKAIRALLRKYKVIRWGGDYNGRKDEMHFEINANAAAVTAVAVSLGLRKKLPYPIYGETGSKVRRAQRRLNRVASTKPKLKVDGDFGEKTQAAVKQFQLSDEILKTDADGHFGPVTWQRLKKAASIVKTPTVPTPPTSTRGKSDVPLAFVPMQFSDTDLQMEVDARRTFARAKMENKYFVGGTEAGAGAGRLAFHLKRYAEASGYRFHHVKSQDCWVAVRKDLIDGNWSTFYEKVVDGQKGVSTDRGVLSVSFNNDLLGYVTVVVAHYMTKGKKPGDIRYGQNVELAKRIDVHVNEKAKGKGIVFYMGDQNMPDNVMDTFLGGNMISAGDELKKHESTGHGPIDVIASHSGDSRVKAIHFDSENDKEFPLNTDHYWTEATFEVKHV